ncbi:MAG: hypothetical protein QXF21_01425, partial [Thermoproteota archaeon]
PNFDLNESLWNAWMDIVHDSHLSCVKLDWGDQNDDFKRLSGIYHNYVQTCLKGGLASTGLHCNGDAFPKGRLDYRVA